ncbi:2OG-Fe(II) oxygenase family protein [Rhodovibrionaceae bacterium A322]
MQLHDTGEPVVLAFPTPIYKTACPLPKGFNAALKKTIMARRDQHASTNKSNIGGWQSSPDFMNWGGPEVRHLGNWLNEAFGSMMEKEIGHRNFNCNLAVTAWANINKDGDYNRQHTHANNHWSAVYYVDLGDPDPNVLPNGAIEFMDPRSAIGVFDLPGVMSVSTWTVQPEPGNLIMFPSWLKHSVLPFRGKGERISIAFNLRVGDMKPA